MIKAAALCFGMATASCAFSQENKVVKFVNTPGVAIPKGYSTTAQIDMGTATMIIVSGIVSLDPKGNVVGKGDFALQTKQIFENLKLIVEDAGGKMDDVVKLGIFFKDISSIQTFRDIRNQYINLKNPPTSTAVEVSKFVREEFLLEMEATVVIKK